MIVAGTGHRLQRLPLFEMSEVDGWAQSRISLLRRWLEKVRPVYGISGMAQGWDTWLAEALVDLGIPLFAAVPFKGQESKWPDDARKRYERLLTKAYSINYCKESYTKDCFFVRDAWMVDQLGPLDALLACWDTVRAGGTWWTVNYALNKRLHQRESKTPLFDVLNFYPDSHYVQRVERFKNPDTLFLDKILV